MVPRNRLKLEGSREEWNTQTGRRRQKKKLLGEKKTKKERVVGWAGKRREFSPLLKIKYRHLFE